MVASTHRKSAYLAGVPQLDDELLTLLESSRPLAAGRSLEVRKSILAITRQIRERRLAWEQVHGPIVVDPPLLSDPKYWTQPLKAPTE